MRIKSSQAGRDHAGAMSCYFIGVELAREDVGRTFPGNGSDTLEPGNCLHKRASGDQFSVVISMGESYGKSKEAQPIL